MNGHAPAIVPNERAQGALPKEPQFHRALNDDMLVIGASFDPIEVTPLQMIVGTRTIESWVAGTPADSEATLRFLELTGVRPMIETYPLEKAAAAYARMLTGEAQFRVALTM
jgi:D-arabinose 1-dehydrogenase-like Zn-dependent alcohol dehydrogenase